MRYVAWVIYIVLILPLLPLAGVCCLGEKLTEAKWPGRWIDWARKLTKKVTGV